MIDTSGWRKLQIAKQKAKEELVARLEKIINSCTDVKQERDIHKDAKDLASLVIRDLNILIKDIT